MSFQVKAKKSSQIIDQLFLYRCVEQLEQYLEGNPAINIIALIDTQGNNLLHQLAFEGHLELIKVYVRKVQLKARRITRDQPAKDPDHKEFKNWINHRNNQGYTPLLYASFSGHLEIIRYFIEKGADPQLKTNTGLNALHLAAQKNIIMPFLLFRDTINLYDLDDLKSSPLHWAAYTNSQQVVAYILAETTDRHLFNIRDMEGNTPLMLATTYGNTRVVRRLLITGANRYIQNDEGKIPLDIARESQFKTITRMLDQSYSIGDMLKFYCNIKIEYRPKGRKLTIPLIFVISFIVNLAIINFFISFTNDIILYSQIAFMAIMFAYYISLLCQNPKHQSKRMQSLLQDYNERTIKKVCFICRNKNPKRGYHCDICGVCIQQYDHHCTWINNCVGKKNIARFIIFIVMLVLSFAFIGTVAVLASLMLLTDDPTRFQSYFLFRYPFDTLEKYCMVGCFLVNQVTSLFIFPVCLLCIVQIKNLLTNKTTFEKIKSPNQEPNKIKNKYRKTGKISLRNCKVMCADTRASFATTSRSSFSDMITQNRYISQKQEVLIPKE